MKNVTKIYRTLGGILLGLSLLQSTAQAENNIATLDWTTAETLIALGEPPLAVGDVQSYQRWVAEPALPAQTIDLGIRLQPNPEQIFQLKKQLQNPPHFINSSFYAAVTPMLEKSAKVDLVDFYGEGNAWQNVQQATEKVARLIGKPDSAQHLLQHYAQTIAELKPQAAPFTARPIILVQFIDTRHLRIYAQNSLLGAVLEQLGFQNAWQGSHNIWGFETIEVTKLA